MKSEMKIILLKFADYYNRTLEDSDFDFFWNDIGHFPDEDFKLAFENWRKSDDGKYFPRSGQILREIKKLPRKFIGKKICMVSLCGNEAFANLGKTWTPAVDFYICSNCFYDQQKIQEAA